MDEREIRRHGSATRLAVLRILDAGGPADEAGILEGWLRTRPELSARHIQELPRMIHGLVWKLEILEWVRCVDGIYELTSLGNRVLDLAKMARAS
ncbi:hypothetical protein [Microbacterium memoriense]|uniref:ArsR family transcriptional regulator n=1 Tax=Microbacterium memoriense TaxID=2978350 RepID=A0ABT2PAS0_9MICO|nr:hypothetical protein [Microbacterium memoriense]MCT9001670.1 hypothetical protein [Microbacterium memoriense]